MKHFVVGTAGHKGHGKTSVIRTLTGAAEKPPDGLESYAQMRFDETLLELVELPGRARDALGAGAADADMILLVVAADEGVAPGTLEHLRILSLLDISRCIVVLTKTDLVDEDALVCVREAIRGLYGAWGLPAYSPVVELDARTGAGAEALLAAIVEQCARMPIRRIDRPFYMHLDKTVCRDGGASVSGTVLEGRVLAGEEIMLCPGGDVARVCAIRDSARPLAEAQAGQRVFLELAAGAAPQRGGALSAVLPGPQADNLDVRVIVLPESGSAVEDGARLLIHVGTACAPCRVRLPKGGRLAPGESGYGQLIPEAPLAALSGEHFVLCFPDAEGLAGGGIILDAKAPLRGRNGWRAASARMSCYEYGGQDGRLHWEASAGLCTESMLRERFARWSDAEFRRTRDLLLAKGLLIRAGDLLLGAQLAGALKGELIAQLTRRHAREPLEPGMPLEEARNICPGGLLELCLRDGTVRLHGFSVALPLFDPRKTRRYWQLAMTLTEQLRREGAMSCKELAEATGFPEREVELAMKMLERDGLSLPGGGCESAPKAEIG